MDKLLLICLLLAVILIALVVVFKKQRLMHNINGSKEHSIFKCNPKKYRYIDTCKHTHQNLVENNRYNTLKDCQEECDSKFISIQLKKANLYKETSQFHRFIQDLITNENINVYIKGGNVIGLAVLKVIYDAYKHNHNKFKHAFNNFLKMNLIKDWDFIGYTVNNDIDDIYRAKLDTLAMKQKLVPRAKTFILYQAKRPILVDNKALFEIVISDLESSSFSKMEIPMTTMKIRINFDNIKYIFMLAKSFYSWSYKQIPIDLDLMKKILSLVCVETHPHSFGLYNPRNQLDTGALNIDLVKFINDFTNNNIYWTQFLITQLEDPYRIIYRMPEKNIIKADLITNFIKHNIHFHKPISWLIDPVKTTNTLNRFTKTLSIKLVQIYKQTNSLNAVFIFLSGAYFGKPQIQIEWRQFNQDTKSRLKNIFNPLITEIGLDNFKNQLNKISGTISIEQTNFIKLFKFLLVN